MASSYSAPYSFKDWRNGQVKNCEIKKVDIPSNILWEVLSDVKSYHEFLPHVKSIEIFTDSPQDFREGVRYKQVSNIKEVVGINCELQMISSVIDVKDDESSPRSARIALTLNDDFKDTSFVWGWEIHKLPSNDEEAASSTNLVVTLSLQAGGFCNMLYFLLLGCYVHKVAKSKLCDIAEGIEKTALRKIKERQTKDFLKQSGSGGERNDLHRKEGTFEKVKVEESVISGDSEGEGSGSTQLSSSEERSCRSLIARIQEEMPIVLERASRSYEEEGQQRKSDEWSEKIGSYSASSLKEMLATMPKADNEKDTVINSKELKQ